MARRTPSPKKQAEFIIRDGEYTLGELYARMKGHVKFEFTEEMARSTLVKPEDLQFIEQSAALYGHLRNDWSNTRMIIEMGEAGLGSDIQLSFSSKLGFVPPRYMNGRQAPRAVRPEFFEAITPWVDQIKPMRDLFETARSGWKELQEMTNHDPVRIYALWPAVAALAQAMGKTFPKLPKPNGLPSPSPELREKLNVAETFINAAIMMPVAESENPVIRIDYA